MPESPATGSISSVVVDDERLARAELERLLAAHPEVRVVGEAATLREARSAIEDLTPDLVFLDIQLPDGMGFDLFPTRPTPAVVFTTAFDQFAVRAFEVEALDYLLKPIDPKRLAEALRRVAEQLSRPSIGSSAPVQQLAGNDQVLVKEGQRGFLVRIADIRMIEAEGGQTLISWKRKTLKIEKSLSALEQRLEKSRFFRANRQQLINLRWVESVDDWFHGQMIATLRGGEKVVLSRRRARIFRNRSQM